MVSRRSGNIGAGARDSHATNEIMRTAPRPSAMRTSFAVQPASVERIRPHSKETAPAVTRTSPGMSSLVCAPRLSGKRMPDSRAAAMPMGTLTQKIQCQLRPCVTAPPIMGPMAMARPPIPPHAPTIAPRRDAGNALVRMVRLSGVMIAAPTPCTARAAISTSMFGASAHAADAALKR